MQPNLSSLGCQSHLLRVLLGACCLCMVSSQVVYNTPVTVEAYGQDGEYLSSLWGDTSSWKQSDIHAGFYYHLDAKYYLVGTGPEVMEFWNPFEEDRGGGEPTAVHLKAVMDFVLEERGGADQADTLTVKVINRGWGGVVSDTVCDGTEDCPALVMIGTTQVATRYGHGDVASLNSYLDEFQAEFGYPLYDDFIKYYFYDFNKAGSWIAVPLVSDIRVLAFNKTTFDSLGLEYPPPEGAWTDPYSSSWTWEVFAELAEKITSATGEPGFYFPGGWDEELKLSMMIGRNWGATLYAKDDVNEDIKRSALQDDGKFAVAISSIMLPMLTKGVLGPSDGFIPTHSREFDTWNNSDLILDPTQATSNFCCRDINLEKDSVVGMSILPPSFFNEWEAANQTEMKMAFLPGRDSFLGGSGLFIPERTTTRQRDLGWSLLKSMVNMATEYGLVVRSPPPFENKLLEEPWISDAWATSITQLRASVPPQYPEPSFSEMGEIESVKPFRLMWMEMKYKSVSVDIGVNRTSAILDNIFEPDCLEGISNLACVPCKPESFHFNISSCESATQRRLVTFYIDETCYGGLSLPATEKIGCDYVAVFSFYGIAIIALSMIGGILGILAAVGVVLKRRTPVIRLAQPSFSMVFAVGVAGLCISNLTLLGEVTAKSCLARVWFFGLAFDLAFGALFAKVWRVWRIMENTRQFKNYHLTVKHTLSMVAMMLVLDGIIMSLWHTFDPYQPVSTYIGVGPYEDGTDRHRVEFRKCGSNTLGWQLSFLLFKVILIAWGCYLAFITRNINSNLAEGRHIMFSMYVLALLGIVLGVVNSANVSIEYSALLYTLGFVVSAMTALGLVLAPRLWAAFNGGEVDMTQVVQVSGVSYMQRTSPSLHNHHLPSATSISCTTCTTTINQGACFASSGIHPLDSGSEVNSITSYHNAHKVTHDQSGPSNAESWTTVNSSFQNKEIAPKSPLSSSDSDSYISYNTKILGGFPSSSLPLTNKDHEKRVKSADSAGCDSKEQNEVPEVVYEVPVGKKVLEVEDKQIDDKQRHHLSPSEGVPYETVSLVAVPVETGALTAALTAALQTQITELPQTALPGGQRTVPFTPSIDNRSTNLFQYQGKPTARQQSRGGFRRCQSLPLPPNPSDPPP